MAEERGFFKKNGLATNMVLIQTGTTLIQALVGGDVDIGFTAPPAVVSAVAGGVDLKLILANNLNFLTIRYRFTSLPQSSNSVIDKERVNC